jgi:hypothetical protein
VASADLSKPSPPSTTASADDNRYRGHRAEPYAGTGLAVAGGALWVIAVVLAGLLIGLRQHFYLLSAVALAGPLAIGLVVMSMRQYYRYRAALVQLVKARREKQAEAETAAAAAKAKEKPAEPKPKDPVVTALETLTNRLDGNTTAITNAITSLESKVLNLPGNDDIVGRV